MNNPNTLNTLNIDITNQLPSLSSREAVAIGLFADDPRTPQTSPAGSSDAGWRDVCERILSDKEFKGEAESALFIRVAGEKTGTHGLLLVGLGSRADFNRIALHRAAGQAAREARDNRVSHLYFVVPEHDGGESPERIAQGIAEGAIFGLYDGDFYQQQDDDDKPPVLERLTLVSPVASDALKAATERARIIAEAVNWTRSLSDEPGLSLPPREFARRAAGMAEEFGLRVESLAADEVRARGMGGLAGVGQGSDEEPALIVIRYEPEGVAPDDDGELWAFVGKGITFDTGGISIKHGLDMYEMKADMAGGAAVLGALRAIAQLKPARRVVGIVPAAENMPSGRSIKPGDIVKTLGGYTVEVVDTDAEGRLVLIDGIAYARQLGATRIVDLATLTGSIVVALGDLRTGLFSNNDDWAQHVLAASARAGEPTWRMPVSDDYKKRIVSDIADFKNYGGRPDATSAALLLSKFAADTPWAHLDIAGTSWYEDPQPHAPQGSTGTGVRTLVELVCHTQDA